MASEEEALDWIKQRSSERRAKRAARLLRNALEKKGGRKAVKFWTWEYSEGICVRALTDGDPPLFWLYRINLAGDSK